MASYEENKALYGVARARQMELEDQAAAQGQAAPQVSGGSVAPPAPTPAAGQSFADMIRQASTGQSEDFGRFSNEQILAWQGAYDPLASALAGRPQFRSEGGGGALVDKPTECPPGTTLHGSNCVAYANLPSWAQGSYGMGDTGQRAGGTWAAGMAPVATPAAPQAAANPLTTVLAGLQSPTGPKTTTGDPFSTPSPAGPYGGYTGGQKMEQAPVSTPPLQTAGSLTSLMAPMQGGFMAPTQQQSGLTNMLKQRQKVGGWF